MSTLDEIQARADAATEGPWACEPMDGIIYPSTPWSVFSHEANDAGDYPSVTDDNGELALLKADAVFIAHSREDVPKLVAALKSALEVLNDFPPPPKSADPTGEVLRWMEALADDAKHAIRQALDG